MCDGDILDVGSMGAAYMGFVHSPSDKGFGSIKQMVRGSTFDPSKLLTPLLTYLTEETIAACELSP
jgi:hypothetical protein